MCDWKDKMVSGPTEPGRTGYRKSSSDMTRFIVNNGVDIVAAEVDSRSSLPTLVWSLVHTINQAINQSKAIVNGGA